MNRSIQDSCEKSRQQASRVVIVAMMMLLMMFITIIVLINITIPPSPSPIISFGIGHRHPSKPIINSKKTQEHHDYAAWLGYIHSLLRVLTLADCMPIVGIRYRVFAYLRACLPLSVIPLFCCVALLYTPQYSNSSFWIPIMSSVHSFHVDCPW